MTNINGKTYAMNAITPMKTWKTPLLRLVFFLLGHVPGLGNDLVNLSFIHFARWVIVPRDAFPPGRAWTRDGTEIYVRPKLGFCGNCETGVVEDSEVDRVSDVDLFDERFMPVGTGRRVQITDLFGRARLYRIRKDGRERLAQGIAVSYNCDLIVALVVGKVDDETIAKAAHRFLETNTVQVWLNGLLDGK